MSEAERQRDRERKEQYGQQLMAAMQAKQQGDAKYQAMQEVRLINLLTVVPHVLTTHTHTHTCGGEQVRVKLPAYKMKEEILGAVSSNQVVVISGETGCGKTTQVPQLILDEEVGSGRGGFCNIICTQPRRISAIAVAERVADERAEPIGRAVGWQIRLVRTYTAHTAMARDTDHLRGRCAGIEKERRHSAHVLYHGAASSASANRQDARRRVPHCSGRSARTRHQQVSLTHMAASSTHFLVALRLTPVCACACACAVPCVPSSDFLLIILRDLLAVRPDLKLVLMSATLNADLFSRYFGNAPTIEIPGFTHPVTEHYLEDIIEMTQYVLDPTSPYAKRDKNGGGRDKKAKGGRAGKKGNFGGGGAAGAWLLHLVSFRCVDVCVCRCVGV
jgi:uncharacterized membrane protein YgcG